MKQHIGVKLINAKPMTRQEYNDFRGWPLPADENGADEMMRTLFASACEQS